MEREQHVASLASLLVFVVDWKVSGRETREESKTGNFRKFRGQRRNGFSFERKKEGVEKNGWKKTVVRHTVERNREPRARPAGLEFQSDVLHFTLARNSWPMRGQTRVPEIKGSTGSINNVVPLTQTPAPPLPCAITLVVLTFYFCSGKISSGSRDLIYQQSP